MAIKIRIKRRAMLKGAIVVLRNKEGSMLLLKRDISSRWAPEKWGFPGGKIDEGETPQAAAARELKEETTLSVNSLERVGTIAKVAVFTAPSYSGDVKIDHEHTDFRWVSPSELKLNQIDAAPNVAAIYDAVVNR
jgi:8-oxo-dGTP diphosphatase